MKENIPAEMFKPLELPKKNTSQTSSNSYRVYKDKSQFIVVEAENAQKALLASGLKQAYRIERHDIKLSVVLNFDTLSELSADKNPPVAPEEKTTPTELVSTSASLSNEEVDKLLQG